MTKAHNKVIGKAIGKIMSENDLKYMSSKTVWNGSELREGGMRLYQKWVNGFKVVTMCYLYSCLRCK